MEDAVKPALQTGTSSGFELERYKYILGEMHFLNESFHKYLALFQKLAIVVIGAGAAVFVSWRKLDIDSETAKITIYVLLALFEMLTAFIVLTVIAGIFSWMDYRNEEVALLDQFVRPGFRQPPRGRNFLRWHETYVVILMCAIALVAFVFVRTTVIPFIK